MTTPRKIIKAVAIVMTASLAGIFFAFWRSINLPTGQSIGQYGASNQTVTLTVKAGDGPRAIAQQLNSQNLLINERSFLIYVLLTGKRNKFYPSVFDFNIPISIKDLVNKLTNEQNNRITITVIEGWRIADIASEVAKKTSIKTTDFLKAAPVAEYEGYLFPDTYFFTPETTVTTIVKTMRDNFDDKVGSLKPTKSDLILASIVEREARHDEDRQSIAGLYKHRLAIDMPLEADPTVQYAKGSWSPISLSDYRSVLSPYNTYLNKGLPPTPIANPGLKSIKAAIEAQPNEFLFFFNLNDGQTIFSKTFDEHLKNKRQLLK